MRRAKDNNERFSLRSFLERKKKIKITTSVLLLLLSAFFGFVFGHFPNLPSVQSHSHSSVSALFILGDSSVNCGDNSFYSLLGGNSSLYPCNGSDTRLLPDLLAEKMGLPVIPRFYRQNGTIEGLVSGLNFGSGRATIMNQGGLDMGMGFQALNQQLRQAFETIQLLQMQLGQDKAQKVVESSLFYLSLGKDDYIELFLHDSSGLRQKCNSEGFARILVNQMTRVVKDLYNVNVKKIICMGIGPLGCAPRTLWESYNYTAGAVSGTEYCVDMVNDVILEYNAMLYKNLLDLNSELLDAQIIFCDVYQGMMQIMTDPERFGFKNINRACCGLGRYGGMVGCVAKAMACDEPSTYVWWDFYNPTQAVNSLLADSIWFGKPFDICRPISIRQMASTFNI